VDLHYEVELALIIGKRVKDLEPDDEKGALDAIESMFSVICLLVYIFNFLHPTFYLV